MINRRNFLKNLSLSGAVVATPSAIVQAGMDSDNKKNKGPLQLKGKVHCAGKGVADVVVTDGKNVTKTDKKGLYNFSSSEGAEFVYISIPAGYHFNVKENVVRFYAPISHANSVVENDFELFKLDRDDDQHQFVLWADPQILTKEDGIQLITESAPDLKALVQSYPSGSLFHGFGCGDLVWDKFELFDDYKKAVAIAGIPFFNVLGNHDMDVDVRTDDLSDKTFKQHFGPTYYSFNRGKAHYVVLDDVFYIGKGKKYIGYITEEQLAWLEKDLSYIKPGSLVIVNLHIPTTTGEAVRYNKEEELWNTVSNRNQLYNLLEPYQVHLLSGHTHYNENWEAGNMMEHNHGAVCGAWWTGPVCSDGTPNGYGVYEVTGNKLKWFYKSTGKPNNHQFRIYKLGELKESPEEICVNVWNWDKQWKVEWAEDGVPKGAMEQRIGLDPLATSLYQGADKPAKHPFAEPTLTDHLFYAKPSKNAKELKVRVVDRFGSMYTETVQL